MTAVTQRSTADPRWQRAAFTAAVLSALALIGVNGLLLLQPRLFTGFLNRNVVDGAASHFKILDHRVHDITFGLLYGTGAIGLLTQLRAPRKNVAGQLIALTPWAALASVMALTSYWVPFGTRFQMYATAVLGGFTLSATLLHPTGRRLLRSFAPTRASRPMLALTAVAVIPLLTLAVTNIDRQGTETPGDIHWQLGHYGFMAALALTIIGVATVASLRPVGWRVAAWVAGALPATLGVLSLAYPDVDSSVGPAWSLAATAWGATFVTFAERARRATTPGSHSPLPLTTGR